MLSLSKNPPKSDSLVFKQPEINSDRPLEPQSLPQSSENCSKRTVMAEKERLHNQKLKRTILAAKFELQNQSVQTIGTPTSK